MEAVQVISVVFFDKNVFIVIMCDFIEICCKDMCFYLYKQVLCEKYRVFIHKIGCIRKNIQVNLMFFRSFALSLHKIGCIREKHSSKLDVFSLICTIFAT